MEEQNLDTIAKEFQSEYDMLKEIRRLRNDNKQLLKRCYEYVLKQDETEEAILLRSDLVDQL